MNKRNRKKFVAVLILVIFSLSIYSGYNAEHHPYIMPSYPNLLDMIGLHHPNTPNLPEVVFKNLTPYANTIQIGYKGEILGNSNNTNGYTGNFKLLGFFCIWKV